MKMKRILLIILAFVSLVGVMHAEEYVLTPDQKLRTARAVIEQFYVEDLDNDTIVDEAIRAMLKTLDPHSSYTTPSETKAFTEPLEGKFSGIGIQFNMLEDTVYVVQTITGGPSQKVGLLAGDRIISANDTILAGKKLVNTEIMKVLRGPKGSTVNLKVKRGDEMIDFSIVRDDIPLYSVDEIFMADPTTGYIRVTRFAEDTNKEVQDAIAKLRRQGMQNLIIDLSDNGGGYLGSAFEMASQFLPKGTPVVSTSGRRSSPQQYVTEGKGIMQDGRVVLIVNQTSASASEILAGALQDNDRAVIVGRRTFGKGLVQRPFPFPDGSMIRLTVARYYTPSGRCIQKHYDKGHGEEYQLDLINRYKAGELWHADSIAKPDSLQYRTLKNHRIVYGGGGIIPDVFVPADTSHYSVYYRDLVAKGIINRTCINYVDAHRAELKEAYPSEEAYIASFVLPEELLQKLQDNGTAAGIEFNAEQYECSLPMIRAIMTGLVANDLYEKASYFRHLSSLNKDFQTALSVINDPKRYERILKTGE